MTGFATYGLVLLAVTAFNCVISPARLTTFPIESPSLYADPATLILSLKEAFFVNTIPLVLPMINEFAKNIKVPAQHTTFIDIDEIGFSQLNLGKAAIKMKSPNQFFLSSDEITAEIPETNFVIKAGFLTCKGKMQAFITNTSSSIPVNVSRLQNGTLQVKAGDDDFQFGIMNISHSIEGKACNAIQSIIEAFLGDLDKLIISSVKKEVPKRVGPVIEEKMNQAFAALPITFITDPDISSEQLILNMNFVPDTNNNISLEPHPSVKPNISQEEIPDRNLAIITSSISINNYLKYLHFNNELKINEPLPLEFNSSVIEPMYPEAFKLCPNCPITISFLTMFSPSFNFGPDETITFTLPNGFFALEMIPSFGDNIPLIETLVNFTGGVTHLKVNSENRLEFNITEVNLQINLIKSNIGEVDLFKLSEDICWVLNKILIPLFNIQFEGVELPEEISKALINISSNAIVIGFNVEQKSN